MQQRKEGTPLSPERAHEIFNGLTKGRDFSYEAELPVVQRNIRYIAMQLYKKLTALLGKTLTPILQFRGSDNPEQIRRLCDEAFDIVTKESTCSVAGAVEKLESWAKLSSIRHEIKFRFQKICKELGIPTEMPLKQAQT